MSYRIRPSAPHDADRIMAIWRGAVDATHDFLSDADRVAIEAEVARFLPTAPLLLAIDADDWPIGFMLLDESRIEALFVDPHHHGRGAGRALLAHALTHHPVLDADVNAQNAQAAGFYARMGFVPVGESDRDGQGRPYPLIHLRRPA
ncbi:acetyltransferase [Sphingobium ummariense]|nr:acetyltransferase [Sphingobium ummariense]